MKILIVVTFDLLRLFCDDSYRLSDPWVPFAKILVNWNTLYLERKFEVDRLILSPKGKYIF